MTETDPWVMGPPPGYVPPPAPKPPPPAPSREHGAWLAALRSELARLGDPCRCGCGPAVHRHQTTTSHCSHCGPAHCGSYTGQPTRQPEPLKPPTTPRDG